MSKIDVNKIRVVSFDAFNTLFNAKNYHVDACNIILKKYNGNHINIDKFQSFCKLYNKQRNNKLIQYPRNKHKGNFKQNC